MKKLVTAFATFATIASTSALAVDLPVKAPPPLLAPAAVYGWTGWYVGLNAGGGWGRKIDNNLTPGACAITPSACLAIFAAFNTDIPSQFDTDPRGLIGGGQVGYSHQLVPNWFAGLEADFQGSNIRGSTGAINTVSGVLPGTSLTTTITSTASQRLDWFGTFRGRLGWTPISPLLFYTTGGLAYGRVQTATSFAGQTTDQLGPTTFPAGPAASAQSDVRTGWTIGAGLEWMFAPRWSLRAEYLYFDLGSVTLNTTLIQLASGVTINGSANISSVAHYNGNIVRGGLNYHF